ncbi:insulinase family protein [Pelagicoccus sp. SDUM812002]|uniref:M16 family metallopeptidase n=1 Tax=Pelagicoccus sp. SDUM812002 TaxID=3041266 RepID=UPI00280CEA17|nr:insulinase family protein [Pelagicoccus sp. SDUM812002]MDQ8185987.1 insulinase family protein [Pelagicoccus sp. SDUM812002]
MNLKLRNLLPILLFLAPVITLQAGYKLVQAPLPDDLMQVHIYELDNGLTVYLTENDETPTFRSEITVRAGSKDDPADATGLAHYLEHLLFKGNGKMGSSDWEKEKVHIDRISDLYEQHFNEEDPEERARIYQEINKESQLAAQYAIPGEFDMLISSLGGQGINAYTAPDRTVYLEELPSNRLEQWAMIESNRFQDPVFRLFQPELEIVYEEKNRAMDDKDRLIQEALFELLYGDHPYGSQTALGSVEHLKRPSLKKIHEFFDVYYVANNMAIALAGDFEVEEAIEIIDEHFSSWKSGDVPEFDRPMPAPIAENESVTVTYPGQENVMLGFDTAPVGHEDEPALKLIDMILDNANAGLINLNLNQQQRVAQAGSFPYIRNDAGSQFLYGAPKEGQSLEEVESLLLEQLEIIKNGDFDDWILSAIVTDFEKSEKLAMETNAGRLRIISTAYGEKKDWADVVSEIDRMEALTKDDLVEVANKYFSKPYVVAYRKDGDYSPPTVPKPEFDPIAIDRSKRSEFAVAVLATKSDPIEPEFLEKGEDYQVMELGNGVRLFYVENPANDLFALSKVYELGSREMRELPMTSALLDKSGTSRLSPPELKKAWYALGADFAFSVGDHNTILSVSGLDENFDESLSLFQEVLNDSQGDATVLEELVAIQLKQKQDAMKEPSMIFNALRNYTRYGEESPFLSALSSDEIKALSVEGLLSQLNRLSGYEHDYLYVGKMPIKEVAKKLKKLSKTKRALKPAPEPVLPKLHDPESNDIVYVDYETAQSQIRIEFPGGIYDESERPMIETFNEYFYGGMGGIVFQEMREARALAYSVWAHYLVSSFEGGEDLVMGFIGTQADKTVDSLSAYLDLWDNMPNSEDRFAVVKESLDNQYRVSKIGFRDVLAAVKAWERVGLEGDPRDSRYDKIMEGDLEDLFGFYEKEIKGQPKMISILGPSAAIDMEELEKHGEVRQVKVSDIFVD